MPFCTSCGKQMEGSFCISCGAPAETASMPAPIAAAAPPAATPVTPKKTSPLIWVVVGCFGLIVIVGIVFTIGGFFVAKKVGEVVDVEKGKITLPGKNGEKVEFSVKGEGESGSLEVKTSEGTARFGAGSAADIPSWLPSYPGSTPEGAFSGQGKDGTGGMFSFKTNDAADKVLAYYEQALTSAGFKTTKHVITADEKAMVATVQGKDEGRSREVSVMVTKDDGATRIAVTYTGK
jgi:hypothetical protein